MSSPQADTTAVVTVSYNSSSELTGFLGSVVNGDLVPLMVIADNASADVAETRGIAQEFGADVLGLPENHGYGGAINAAVRTLPTRVEFILISNPDVRVTPAAVRTLASALAARPDLGAVGPRVLNEDGSGYPSARAFPSLRTGVGHALLFTIWPGNPWSHRYLSDREGAGEPRTVDWLSGSCLMVRRSAFDAVGGFDEGYFMYFEDVDLGYRLAKAGWKRLFLPTTEVVHSGAHSTTTESARMIRAHHDSAYRYLSKKYDHPLLAPLRWALRVGLDARAWYLTRSEARPLRGGAARS
jgi:N-acetylglucosaminyl-diphospho-decaprenol L-rhamnosyltransferase